MSPAFAIQRFTGAGAKYGENLVLTDHRFKKAREVRATAAFLLGLSRITGKTYWVMPEYESSTPDTYGVSFSPHATMNGNVRELLSVEVTEYEAHSEKGIVAFIKRKLSNKYLPDHYILLVHANKTEKINVGDVIGELAKERFKVGEVWLLSHIQDESNDKFAVVCLYPTRAQALLRLEDELAKNTAQPDMLRASRSSGKTFSEGTLVVRLPELE